jgi:hypothetical protein
MAYNLLNVVEKFEYVTHGLNNCIDDNNFFEAIIGVPFTAQNFCGLALRLSTQMCVSLNELMN